MKNLTISGSRDGFFVPTVKFNAETGICEIAGESYLHDTIKFYFPLVSWLKQYMTEIKKPIFFNIKLTYFNTSTSKSLFDILLLLKRYQMEGNKVEINWYYEEKDMDMEEAIEDYETVTKLDVNKIPL